jgi:predicted nucleic-acid-binding protein
MIAIDTNILVRIFVADDERQMHAARNLIAGLQDSKVFLSNIVLVEFVWVLIRSYKQPKPFVIDLVNQLVASDDFEIENLPAVLFALTVYGDGKADFSDCLIFAVAKLAGAGKLYSFDRAAAKFIPDVLDLMEEKI